MTIEITLLGTGTPLPDPTRVGPSTLVRAGGLTFLFDAGRGVGLRLAAAAAPWSTLTAVLLTHLHSDHITDLNDAVTGRWITSFAPNPLTIIGPGDTQQVVDGILAMLAPDIRYRIDHHEDLTEGPEVHVTESAGGVVFEDAAADVRIIAAPTDHRPVEPTLGYRIEHAGKAVVIGGDGVPCGGWTSSAKAPTPTCRPCCARTWSARSRCSGSSTPSTTTRRSPRPARPRNEAG